MRIHFLKYTLLVVLLTFVQRVVGQSKQFKLDSLKQQFKNDSAWIFRPKKIFPLVAIDQRNTFLKTSRTTISPVNMWGAKAGVTLFDRHNLGIGLYQIQNISQRTRPRDGAQINQNLTFQYATVFYEYSFIETRWWEIGIPVEAGYGIYKTTTANLSTGHTTTRTGNAFPLGTALDIYFKPTRWFGINIMGGYRYVINNESRLNLNGWFYSVGGAVYIRQIFQDSKYLLKRRVYREEVKKTNLLPY